MFHDMNHFHLYISFISCRKIAQVLMFTICLPCCKTQRMSLCNRISHGNLKKQGFISHHAFKHKNNKKDRPAHKFSYGNIHIDMYVVSKDMYPLQRPPTAKEELSFRLFQLQ